MVRESVVRPLNRRFLIAVASATLFAIAAAAGIPMLAPRVDVPLGPQGCEVGFTCSRDPQGIVLVDVNGDGRLDAVTVNNGSDDITILLNDGSGRLQSSATIAVGEGPSGIAAADFNRDGRADLAVANTADSTVGIFFGNGDATFAAGPVLPVGHFPERVVAADFNGDGAADFATSDLFGDTITVRLGDGAGDFFEPITTAVGQGPVGLATGDFNGDGSVDLAVTLDELVPGRVAILLGQGDGRFVVQPQVLAAGDAPRSVAVGDFDDDGVHDLAVANWGEDTVSIFFGSGDGTFADGPVLDVGLVPEDVAVVDLDGDGAADVVTLDGFGSPSAAGLLVVVPGRGDGTFAAAVAFALGAGPSALAVGDLQGDRSPDIVTAHYDSDDLAVTLNLGGPFAGCTGDCNGDGLVSIAELITGVNIALGQRPVADCTAFDRDANGAISIAELVAGVNNALAGCGVESATQPADSTSQPSPRRAAGSFE